MVVPARCPPWWRLHLLLVVVAASTLLAACSCTGSAPTTAAPTDVPPATTAPAVTDAPTTTQAPNAATPLVRQAVLDYWSASRACGQRPKSCTPNSITVGEGTLRADVQTYVAMLISSNSHLGTADTVAPGGTPVPTDTSYVVVNAVTIELSNNSTATTDECVYDPTPLLGPPGPDGTTTVISADAVPRRFVHTFYLEDGRWLPGGEDADTSAACNSTPDTVAVEYTTPGS
ncbi:MAG: hypothetical protein ABJA16_14235 [Nakamurella sp.]